VKKTYAILASSVIFLSFASVVPSLAETKPQAQTEAASQENTHTLSQFIASPEAAPLLKILTEKTALPDWIPAQLTESPAEKAEFGGKKYVVLQGCKQHACNSEQIAIMYNAQDKLIYGLLRTITDDGNTEQLKWLNIGGNDESIDGRTILYAALTGSLSNHPNDFNYK
jgi:hypothetical protein